MLGLSAKSKNDEPVEKPPEFSVRIHPFDDIEKTARIIFPTKLVKDAYVKVEYRFCKKEYAEYWGAPDLDARGKAFGKLAKRRIVFARTKGYGPKSEGSAVWILKNPKPEPVELA